MAPKPTLPVSSIFLLFILLPLFSRAKSQQPKGGKPSSPFQFLENLQGSQKGDNVNGLHEVRQYLNKFGYLNYHPSEYQTQANCEHFDDQLEAAIKTYQLNYNLSPTGTLDAQTISKMMMPRCGVPDISIGTNWMRDGKKSHGHSQGDIDYFADKPTWPADKAHLTFAFLPGTPADAMTPITQAFNQWASASQYFTFSQTNDSSNADLKIGFYRGAHGDNNPFTYVGDTIYLAHAYPPPDGRMHFNADLDWSIGSAVPGAYDYEAIALHEIGHLLGLSHSKVKKDIMWPIWNSTKSLNGDDIRRLKALYHLK